MNSDTFSKRSGADSGEIGYDELAEALQSRSCVLERRNLRTIEPANGMAATSSPLGLLLLESLKFLEIAHQTLTL
jgi:hypothetical protein